MKPFRRYHVMTDFHGPQWLEILRDDLDYLQVQRIDINHQPIPGCIPYKLYYTDVRLLPIRQKVIVLKG